LPTERTVPGNSLCHNKRPSRASSSTDSSSPRFDRHPGGLLLNRLASRHVSGVRSIQNSVRFCRMLYFCRHATALNPNRVDSGEVAALAMRTMSCCSQRQRNTGSCHGITGRLVLCRPQSPATRSGRESYRMPGASGLHPRTDMALTPGMIWHAGNRGFFGRP
jgi:hypothetical protein